MRYQKNNIEMVSEADEGSLSVYLREINEIPLLSREEEILLARNAKQGSEESKEKLIVANLRFVVNMAKRYQNKGLPLSDLINEGNLGLITAADKYDVDKGYHFISYAVWWIKQSILKAIGEKSRMIRLPLNRANEIVRIEKVKISIEKEKGSEVGIEEIADYLNLEKQRVVDLLRVSKDTMSLETPLSQGNNVHTVSDLMEDHKAERPDGVVIDSKLHESIKSVLLTLNATEAEVIKFRFGLEGVKPHSLKEIGEKYNITKERVRQIEKKAINRLRHPTRRRRLESFFTE